MPHTHAHNHLDKGAIDRVPLEPWLQHLAARLAGRTPRDIYVGAAFGAIEMLHSGTTWACEMANVLPWRTGAALDAVVQAYVDVGVRASINVQVLDLSSPPRYALDEMLAAVRVAVERWHGAAGGRIRFGIGPSVLTACSDALLERAVALTREHDLTLQVHLSETRSEADAARQRFGTSATARCHARGGNVALGTDGSANSDNQNLFGPLRLAAILPRAPELDARRWPSTRDVLEMVTANGARGSGLTSQSARSRPWRKPTWC